VKLAGYRTFLSVPAWASRLQLVCRSVWNVAPSIFASFSARMKACEKPWTVKVPFRLVPDTELIEGGGCDGHDKTMEHRRIEPQPPEPPSPR